MAETTDVLIEALCKAAFAPQHTFGIDTQGHPQVMDVPSPLVQTLASAMQRSVSENEVVRALLLEELTKPESIKMMAGEISKGIGRMRVNDSYYGNAAEVPLWIREALTVSLVEWLGTEEASGLVPQMLERGTIKITVERKDSNDKK